MLSGFNDDEHFDVASIGIWSPHPPSIKSIIDAEEIAVHTMLDSYSDAVNKSIYSANKQPKKSNK